MKILGIECSAGAASCAVCDGDRLLGQFFIDVRRTHSETLMPMTEALLDSVNVPLGEIGGFAVSAGPGSFTGVRIGVAAVKGMAQPSKTGCAGVSSLEAAARIHREKAVICAVSDARCGQVYNALFETGGPVFRRLCPDRALSLDELGADLERLHAENPAAEIILTGDGLEIAAAALSLPWLTPAQPPLDRQTAYGVILAARETLESGGVPPGELAPVYLRAPRAERELKKGDTA